MLAGISGSVTDATLELYEAIISRLPPTPSRFHYIFNLRDLSRVFQVGMLPHIDPRSSLLGSQATLKLLFSLPSRQLLRTLSWSTAEQNARIEQASLGSQGFNIPETRILCMAAE
jgi:AAA+ lid domain